MKPKVERRISVDLTVEMRQGLQKAMQEWEMDPAEIVSQALEEWLEAQGYLE